LAYLLYDILSNDVNGTIDTQEQTILFDSFPWSIKQFFKEAMKKTVQYTNDLSNFDIQKIPLEQQICLMKTSDIVKEKAITKLKELKNKNEDGGSKVRQFLEGLLKVPFGIYKKEPILIQMDKIKNKFMELMKNPPNPPNHPNPTNYNYLEIIQYIHSLNNPDNFKGKKKEELIDILKKNKNKIDKNNLILWVEKINDFLEKNNLKDGKIHHSNKKKKEVLEEVNKLFFFIDKSERKEEEKIFFYQNMNILLSSIINPSPKTIIQSITQDINYIETFMNELKINLDNSVYGHEKAKKHEKSKKTQKSKKNKKAKKAKKDKKTKKAKKTQKNKKKQKKQQKHKKTKKA
jgi:hypothetical protein